MSEKRIVYRVLIVVAFLSLMILLDRLAYVIYSKKVQNFSVEIEPESCFGLGEKGLFAKEGEYKITINNCSSYTANHLNSQRVTTFNHRYTFDDIIHIYGCSFAYGIGVNDEKTFPFILQDSLRNSKISNFALPGFSTLNSLDQLKTNIVNSNVPDVAILSFATFHEERNALTNLYKSYLRLGANHFDKNIHSYFYPRLIISSNSFNYEFIDILNSGFFNRIFENSYCVKLIEDYFWKKQNENFKHTKLIFSELNKICSKNNIKLIIADVFYNNSSVEIERYCLENDINYINISPDFSAPEFLLLPCDPHPSELAHQVYALKILEYLKNKDINL